MVEPAGSVLVAAPPPRPVQVVANGLPGAGEQVEDPLVLGDGERDQPGVARRWLIWAGGRPRQEAGAGTG